jgi:hypothetical protein
MHHVMISCLATALFVTGAANAAATKRAQSTKASASGDKVSCKRFTRTGSLVDSYKTCKTNREWDRERANLRTAGQSGYCGPRETVNGTTGTTC